MRLRGPPARLDRLECIEKMPNDLDTFLRAEFARLFKGDITGLPKRKMQMQPLALTKMSD
jgi:hypothetical protein